jgi:hypothetical protein
LAVDFLEVLDQDFVSCHKRPFEEG